MTSYALSFEIQSNSTYSDRRKSLMDRVRYHHGSAGYWDETTSFVLFQSGSSLSDLAFDLYINTKINASTDILLVFDPAQSSAIARGPIKYPGLLQARFRYCEVK